MKIFWFDRHYADLKRIENRPKELQHNGFSGIMYPYGIYLNDYFTRIANTVNKDNSFEYIVAIRPYAISPQYLSMICSSINEISSNAVSINFLTGWIEDKEKNFGGIMSSINDQSSNIDRSNFMLEYVDIFKKISSSNFFVSTTNHDVFNYCSNKNIAMIIPYVWYKNKKFNLSKEKYIISIAPVIRTDLSETIPNNMDAELFTEESFFDFLNKCRQDGVYGILIQESKDHTEYNKIIKSINKYKELK